MALSYIFHSLPFRIHSPVSSKVLHNASLSRRHKVGQQREHRTTRWYRETRPVSLCSAAIDKDPQLGAALPHKGQGSFIDKGQCDRPHRKHFLDLYFTNPFTHWPRLHTTMSSWNDLPLEVKLQILSYFAGNVIKTSICNYSIMRVDDPSLHHHLEKTAAEVNIWTLLIACPELRLPTLQMLQKRLEDVEDRWKALRGRARERLMGNELDVITHLAGASFLRFEKYRTDLLWLSMDR